MCWTLSDYLQLGMLVATFFVIPAALFGATFRDWIKRPKIFLKFDKASDRCFRQATVLEDEIQNGRDSHFKNVERVYYRLKVKNEGGLAKNVKVKIDILALRCFMWIDVVRLLSKNPKSGEKNGSYPK
jgi:hypothetical protein